MGNITTQNNKLTPMALALKEYVSKVGIEQVKKEWAEIEKQYPREVILNDYHLMLRSTVFAHSNPEIDIWSAYITGATDGCVTKLSPAKEIEGIEQLAAAYIKSLPTYEEGPPIEDHIAYPAFIAGCKSIVGNVLPQHPDDFIAFINTTRLEFSEKLYDDWLDISVDHRVAIEDLLIAYDQMVDRLTAK